MALPDDLPDDLRDDLTDDLRVAGVRPRTPVALVVGSDAVGVAWPGGRREVRLDPAQVVRALEPLAPRLTWWSARSAAAGVAAAGVRVRTCWDLGAVGRLAHGLRRDDPAAVWAAAHGLPEPALLRGAPDLFDADADEGEPLRADGQLSASWLRGGWAERPAHWAELALEVQRAQESLLRDLPDPRRDAASGPPLAVLTAWAESAAALLAVELERDGLPLDRAAAAELVTAVVGPRPVDDAEEARQRTARDARVLQHFPGPPVDLRSPAQVRELLARSGYALPDTRSWRLEPHAATSPAVAALLAWRKAERTATTYGWSWLERLDADGRLRGEWRSADAAAGRMTASAGLHNLPVELRTAVRAEPGTVLVRADLGQVEPRVLAVVSGDEGLAAAAGADDLYAPVAAALRCERATAKVAVLAAMYGQTTGTAGQALRDLDRAYPAAMAHLRAAEQAGRDGIDLRTYGGRLLRLPGGGSGRFARNAVVQGAAAELFKAWAATVRDGLDAVGGTLVLCLHDELLLQVPEAVEADARALLVQSLEATASWWARGSPVRFVAEVSAGATWAQASG